MTGPKNLKFLFPYLKIKLGEAARKGLQLPFQSVNFKSLPNGEPENVIKTVLHESTEPKDVPLKFRYMKKEIGEQETGKRIIEGVIPTVERVIKQHKEQFGLTPKDWDLTAKRTVYKGTSISPSGGHADIVISLEPLSTTRLIKEPKMLRYFGAVFPGLPIMALSDEQFKDIVAAGREVDGSLVNNWVNHWDQIRQRNAELFLKNEPYSGIHSIGSNSFIKCDAHILTSYEGVDIQSALMATTAVHSQDGIVPWTCLKHPDFPDGLVCISLHFGKNPVPLGDVINSGISGGLFKLIFRQGCLLAEYYPELEKTFGKEKAAGLLLDPQVANKFREFVWNTDYPVLIDTSWTSVVDATGGKILNNLRFFSPNTVATVSEEDLKKIETQKEWIETINKGIAETTLTQSLGNGEMEIKGGFVSPNATNITPSKPTDLLNDKELEDMNKDKASDMDALGKGNILEK